MTSRSSIPREVLVASKTPKPSQPKKRRSSSDTDVDNGKEQTTLFAGAAARILPGSRLVGDEQSIPPPPTEAPPPLQHVVPLMLLGPSSSGKTSLVKSWVDRVPPSATAADSSTAPQEEVDENEDPWCMDYFKKDFSFRTPAASTTSSSSGLAVPVCSVRVQLWDCHGVGPEFSSTKKPDDGLEDWKRVVSEQVGTLLLTVAMDDDATNQDLCATIVRWKNWLDQQASAWGMTLPPVELLLTKGDSYGTAVAAAPVRETTNKNGKRQQRQQISPLQWMRFGAAIDQTCRDCQIVAWHMTTACYFESGSDDDNNAQNGVESTDALFSSLVESTLVRKQRERLESNGQVGGAARSPLSLSSWGSPSKRKRMRYDTSSTIVVQADAVVPITPEDKE